MYHKQSFWKKQLLQFIGITVILSFFGTASADTVEWKNHKAAELKIINGLLWQDQFANSFSFNKKTVITWSEAKGYCANLKVDYYGKIVDGFRLPKFEEYDLLGANYLNFDYDSIWQYWCDNQESYDPIYHKDIHVIGRIRGVDYKFIRCVKSIDETIGQESMSIATLEQLFLAQTNDSALLKLAPKPVEPQYTKENTLQKDEFETSASFAKRVEAENKRVSEINRKLNNEYQQALKQWQKEADVLQKASQNPHSTQFKAIEKALHLKYGNPLIRSVKYDADSQLFDIIIISQKVAEGERASDLSRNLLSEKIDSPKGIFSVTDIRDIDTNTTVITIEFHQKERQFVLSDTKYDYAISTGDRIKKERNRRYKKRDKKHQETDDQSSENTTDERNHIRGKDIFSMDAGDTLRIFVPRVQKTTLDLPLNRYLKNSTVKLQNTPAFQVDLKIPVALKYAREFKALIAQKDFNLTVEGEVVNGEFRVNGIREITDPKQMVMQNAYTNASGNIENLEAFLSNYPEFISIAKAKEQLALLKEEKAKKEAKISQERAQREAKEQEAYRAKKHVGDKVCMNGTMLLFLDIEVTGFIEAVNNDKIQIRIANTEGTSPHYNGVTLRRGSIIWDDYYRWKRCE